MVTIIIEGGRYVLPLLLYISVFMFDKNSFCMEKFTICLYFSGLWLYLHESKCVKVESEGDIVRFSERKMAYRTVL